MQKWEYLILRGEISWDFDMRVKSFMPRFINDEELKDWNKISLVSLMNRLGNDGWELVSSLGYPMGGNRNELLFKRPKL